MPVIDVAASKLFEQLQQSRAESDRLFRLLKPEALYQRPITERHRVIFYIGHLDGFDSIRICREALNLRSPNPAFDDLFQAGIDPDSAHLPVDSTADWPSLEGVAEYLRCCRRHVDKYLEIAPEDVVSMALEHRQMHLETLAYMFHNFPYELKNARPAEPANVRSEGPPNTWCEVPAGEAILGKKRDGTFGWDNEYEEVRVQAPAFRIQRYKVTNGDYLQFVKQGAKLPYFWIRRGNSIYYRGMFGEIPLPLAWPVYVTQQEAQAYASWRGEALPTEAQFHRAAYGIPSGGNLTYPWGTAEPAAKHGNFDFRRWDPVPINATPGGDSAWGVSQTVGNGWEWTSTPFAPFPGFRAHEFYPGYSANFFDGAHYVLKGGSPRTARRLLRRSLRNWFRADYPYVYATFRCVEN